MSPVNFSLGVLPKFWGEMCSNSAKVFQTVTRRVCPMRKLSSLAVLFVLAALLYTFDVYFRCFGVFKSGFQVISPLPLDSLQNVGSRLL